MIVYWHFGLYRVQIHSIDTPQIIRPWFRYLGKLDHVGFWEDASKIVLVFAFTVLLCFDYFYSFFVRHSPPSNIVFTFDLLFE